MDYLLGADADKKLYNLLGSKSHSIKDKILVYGNVNTNIIDGSSIWLINTINLFARRYKVDLLLKVIPENSLLISEFEKNENINIISPDKFKDHLSHFGDSYYLSDYSASELIFRLDLEYEYHFIVCRGFDVTYYLSNNPYIKEKLITYLLVQHDDFNTLERKKKIDLMVKNSRIILVQTELAKEKVLENCDVEKSKILLLPPVINDFNYSTISVKFEKQNTGCLYAGKFDLNWRIADIIQVFSESKKTLTLVGNKFHDQIIQGKKLRVYILDEINKSNNIKYSGALPHNSIPELIHKYDYGISVRSDEFLNSLEFSTKVLEFGYLGKPTIVNDSKINRLVLGDDYPLFANTNTEVLNCLKNLENDDVYKKAAKACFEASQKYRMSYVAAYLVDSIEDMFFDKCETKTYITKININNTNLFETDKSNNILYMNDLELYSQEEPFFRSFKWSDIIIYYYQAKSIKKILEFANWYTKKIIVVYEEDRLDEVNQFCNDDACIKISRRVYDLLDSASLGNLLRIANNELDLSVIISTRNTPAAMLYRAINSVLNQNNLKKFKYEIIVIDDESEELVSEKINLQYDKSHPIRVIRNVRNQGLGLSRNIGLEHSKGKHIYFLDADDFYNDIFISSMEGKLNGDKCNLVICKMSIFYEDKGIISDENHINTGIVNLFDADHNLVLKGAINLVNTVVKGFRRKDMLQNRYLHDIGYHEDIFPWIKYYFQKEPLIGISTEARYIRTIRENSDQITRNKKIVKVRYEYLSQIYLKIYNLLNHLNINGKYDELISYYYKRNQTVKDQIAAMTDPG